MNLRKVFSLILVIFGEAILVLSFLHFGRNSQTDILTLNIIVSSLIYCLLFLDVIIPWVDLRDKSQKSIGSIGLRWFVTALYIVLAISVMVVFNREKPMPFTTQMLIHFILFFLLLVGLFTAFLSTDKVTERYTEESQSREPLGEIKKATKDLQLKLDAMKNIPEEVTLRIGLLQENLRFLSPSNNQNALELEKRFVDEIRTLSNCFIGNNLMIDKIDDCIKNCERTYKERKQVFSN